MLSFRNMMFVGALAAGTSVAALSQELPNEGPVPTTVLINAESKNNTQLDPAMVKVEVNGRAAPIEGLTPARGSSLQVAILIDDGLRTSFGLQLEEVQKLIQELPQGTQILLGYMQNGTVSSSGRFSNDRMEIAKDLRVPFSTPGVNASPYFCLSDFVKHWPSREPGNRVVLMITNGVDPYNGSVSPLNQDSPYVQRAADDAQRAGVAVYSVYYGLRAERGPAVSFSGQGYLSQVAEATGGQMYNQGTITPPSLLPFFRQFEKALNESYNVTFRAAPSHHKDPLVRLKVKTTQSGVKIHAPDAVAPGGAS